MPKPLNETALITEAAAAQAKKSGRMLIQFISPGWGSSGYYSPAVLEQAATDGVIPAGTHMYADHPTDTEDAERPVRSIKDLMAVTTEDAHLAADGALVGEVQVVPAWRDLVETVKDSIGVSIRGSATDIVVGEAEGRTGGIIEGLVAPVMSVDFVTRPGRGGKVLSVLESARATRRAVQRGVEEATADERREQLSDTVRAAYGATDRWLWVRDFDETTVWFEISAEDEPSRTWQQSYEPTDDDLSVSLTGDRIEVRAVTKYVPATRPDTTTSTTTTESEEDTMPEIKIDEAEHTRLVAEAGRVSALEAENAQLKEDAAARDRRDRATELVAERATEAKVEFTALETRGLLAELPLTEAGELDEAEFTKTVDEAAAGRPEATAPTTSVTGFGAYAGQPGQPGATESTRPAKNAWGRPLSEIGA